MSLRLVSPTAVQGSISDAVPPLAPAGVTEDEITGVSFRGQWSSNSEPDLKDYRLYLSSTSSTGPFVLVATTTSTFHTFTGLQTETNYWWYVTARDLALNESEPSEVRAVSTFDNIEYFASAPPYPGDTIHPAGVEEGDTIRAAIVSGTGVEIQTNGSSRASSSTWSLNVTYFDQTISSWIGPTLVEFS